MIQTGRYVALGSAIGSQLVRYNPFWHEAMTLEKSEHQTFRSRLIPTGLEDFIQHNPMLIDRAPEPEWPVGNLHDDFVQMPNITRTGLPPSQILGDLRPEFDRPAPDGFVGHINSALEQHLLNLTQA
ncbi:hypothetical protein IMCC21224_1581 [Puniceibacterium sp. IMCC21224]|nr:hypothetical protein IMCC21224_1581 [Puniceibacterium sp. IMCC21224]